MSPPAIEIVITDIGTHTVNDESTEDGKLWLEAFRAAAEGVPGIRRACYAMSDRDPNIAMHFIDTDFGGSGIAPGLKHIMNPKATDLYVIYPHTPDRHVLYAPEVHVVFYHGIDDDKFAALAPEWFTAIEKSDACVGYIWGEIQTPAREDASGNMKLGKGGVMISGWRSKEEHDRDVNKPRVVEAYKAMDGAVKKKDTWGMQVNVVENSGYYHKWRRLTTTDRGDFLPTGGTHSHTL